MRISLAGLLVFLSVALGDQPGTALAQDLNEYKIIAQAMEMAERARDIAAQARTAPSATLRVIPAPDGARYEGETRNSRGHGLGVYTFSNGARYEGEMLDGQWNGFGVYYYETGHANFGLWEDGNSVDAQSVFILAQSLARVEAEAPGAEARAEGQGASRKR